jgi:hypothetical protein
MLRDEAHVVLGVLLHFAQQLCRLEMALAEVVGLGSQAGTPEAVLRAM